MFSLTSVLIALKHCCLKVQNLDKIIFIINKWSNAMCLNCTPNVNLKDYVKAKIGLGQDNYEFIEEAEYFEEMQVDEDQVIHLNLKPKKKFSFYYSCPITK